jgi:hypothetical protein
VLTISRNLLKRCVGGRDSLMYIKGLLARNFVLRAG